MTPELQSVFRVHLPPLDDRLDALTATLSDMVARHGLDDVWMWKRSEGESLAAYLERLRGMESADGAEGTAATKALLRAIERQVRYTNRASEFTDRPGPHHALGVDAYARFSSPMREIVGILTHKEALESLGFEPAGDPAADEALRRQVIASANAAKAMQKRLDSDVELLAIEQLLRDDVSSPPAGRPRRRGTILGMSRNRMFVGLAQFGIDLKVYFDDLSERHGCTYVIEGTAAVPSDVSKPEFRVGDAVELVTLEWDPARRRFVLDPRRV